MKINYIFPFCFGLILLTSCVDRRMGGSTLPNVRQEQLQKIAEIRTTAEKNDDLKTFLAYYEATAISEPEYQLPLTGIEEIEAYYQVMFQRQKIEVFQREIEEIIPLKTTIIEIGTFKKEYTELEGDTLLTQQGKYWNIWAIQADGSLKLKGEAFGFFHPIEHPEALVVDAIPTRSAHSAVYVDQEIPLELMAYNALMEKGVRSRDGVMRSTFFTEDGRFMPFAEPTLNGMDELKPYLIAYSQRGKVTIDSVAVFTYHFEYLGDYLLEYPKFRVKWTVPGFSGRTEGNGIRIWKRQEDQSLKLYREISIHNHLK